jgi:hypothetical protein
VAKLYAFNGFTYTRYDTKRDAMDAGFPLAISPAWPGLPASGVDAALNWANGFAYFFVGDQYYRYNLASDSVDFGPTPISTGFPGLTLDRVDACFVSFEKNKAYFFRGDKYWRFDVAANAVEAGFPKVYAPLWPGLFATDLDGVINYGNGKAYFFKGNQYLRYDLVADHADPGYPLPIAGNWPGLFTSGVKAPIMLGYSGFDRLAYPGDATMTDLYNNTNLTWCAFYLAPAPSQGYTGWMTKRDVLTGLGWGLAPLYVGEQQTEPSPTPGSHNPSAAKGTTDGANAADLSATAGFPAGSVIYLDIETGGPLQNVLKDYFDTWVNAVMAAGYTPGVYCSYLIAEQLKARTSTPVFWTFNLRYPTGSTHTYETPFPTREPTVSKVPFAALWQLAQNVNVKLSSSSTLATCDLDTATVRDPSMSGTN